MSLPLWQRTRVEHGPGWSEKRWKNDGNPYLWIKNPWFSLAQWSTSGRPSTERGGWHQLQRCMAMAGSYGCAPMAWNVLTQHLQMFKRWLKYVKIILNMYIPELVERKLCRNLVGLPVKCKKQHFPCFFSIKYPVNQSINRWNIFL